mmetsp:Transcript_1958/g.2552  ORF Transcript_1958/g.2552 Transcript_1958/m.2552 type:complete len:91 (+) Transcript_1958:34-306(+)
MNEHKDQTLPPNDDQMLRPTVSFRDNNCQWHPLTTDFTSYFRLALVHLGILGWQYAFTENGMDAQCEQMMRIFAPERLVVDMANSVVKPY